MFADSDKQNPKGFACFGAGGVVSTNGGETWSSSSFGADDFAFKDPKIGWAAAESQMFKTIDGGMTWEALSAPPSGMFALSYNAKSDWLFATQFGADGLYISTDEGMTWFRSPYNVNGTGFAFCDDSVGVVAAQRYGYSKWLRTTDGGGTWTPLLIDSECWQPLGIRGTMTFFALTDFGSFLRTDDAWNTWKVICTFPRSDLDFWGTTTGCVKGDLKHLIIQLASGAYLSTDEGLKWQSLCGIASENVTDQRFCISGASVFVTALHAADRDISLWKLDLDSLHNTGYSRLQFADGSRRSPVSPGSYVTVLCSNTTADSSVAEDSAHLMIRYDQNSLTLKSWISVNGWSVVDASPRAGVIEVWLQGSSALNTLPILSTTFSTLLADTVAKIYLEEPVIYSHRKNCDCAVTSNPGNDSVEIDFTGCGGPTLWHFMQTGSIFELLNVQPNPAREALHVELDKSAEGDVQVEVRDILGTERLSSTMTGTSQDLDLSDLPNGTYFLRLSSGGEVRTRRFTIAR